MCRCTCVSYESVYIKCVWGEHMGEQACLSNCPEHTGDVGPGCGGEYVDGGEYVGVWECTMV